MVPQRPSNWLCSQARRSRREHLSWGRRGLPLESPPGNHSTAKAWRRWSGQRCKLTPFSSHRVVTRSPIFWGCVEKAPSRRIRLTHIARGPRYLPWRGPLLILCVEVHLYSVARDVVSDFQYPCGIPAFLRPQNGGYAGSWIWTSENSSSTHSDE